MLATESNRCRQTQPLSLTRIYRTRFSLPWRPSISSKKDVISGFCPPSKRQHLYITTISLATAASGKVNDRTRTRGPGYIERHKCTWHPSRCVMGWLPSCHDNASIDDLQFASWRGDRFFRTCSTVVVRFHIFLVLASAVFRSRNSLCS